MAHLGDGVAAREIRLINSRTLEIEHHSIAPAYAIISHTWGHDEPWFNDLLVPWKAMIGFEMMRRVARLCSDRGYQHFWIDICCIDRSNSAEFAEQPSITSYFKNASICFVYLEDVSDPITIALGTGDRPMALATTASDDIQHSDGGFASAKWFTRAWTLVDLISPRELEFFSQNWHPLGSRTDRLREVHDITGVDPFVLAGGDPARVSVARRMFWASRRKTTWDPARMSVAWGMLPASRRETTVVDDMAYCLADIFGIKLAQHPSEGESAFLQLQEQIIRTTKDLSILAWRDDVDWRSSTWILEPRTPANSMKLRKMLARSPRDFSKCGAIFPPLEVQHAGPTTGLEVLEESPLEAKPIRSIQAQEHMVARSTSLAYPSFSSLATTYVKEFIESKLSEAVGTEDWEAMRRRMLGVVSELEYSRPENLVIESHNELSMIEKFQHGVESFSGEAWIWKPLSRPRPIIRPGESRLGWACACRDYRWVALPREFSSRLSSFLQDYPLTHKPVQLVEYPAQVHTASGQASSTYQPAQSSASPANSPSQPSSNSSQQQQSPQADSPPGPSEENTTPDERDRYMFLMSRLGWLELDVLEKTQHLNTKRFAHKLLSTHRARKGWWRYWFSIYEFSHCEFVQFERFRRDRYSSRGYGLPPDNAEYYFVKDTNRTPPPITPEEFKDLYQLAYRQGKPSVTELPVFVDYGFSTGTVDRIPQRYQEFKKNRPDREVFWGLMIVQRRSLAMTVLYILLSMSPSIAFCILVFSLSIAQGLHLLSKTSAPELPLPRFIS
ncbi:hypothetical protein QBC39DRAFT_104086 [Podospora conica]|nr:hypothetical protein QBC39DRAFT_104086 [Schizothecium conicum]